VQFFNLVAKGQAAIGSALTLTTKEKEH